MRVIKLLGAVFIISATVGCGAMSIVRLRERARALESLITALGIMESEICTHLTPMEETLEMLSNKAPERTRAFFARSLGRMEELGSVSFSEIWNAAVDESDELMLTREERDTVKDMGLSLGKYDVNEQAEAISRARRRLDVFLHKAELERERDSKVKAFFGLAAGAFAVILLI